MSHSIPFGQGRKRAIDGHLTDNGDKNKAGKCVSQRTKQTKIIKLD